MPIVGATASGRVGISFRPNTLSGMAYWLDASQSSSITLDSGAVSQWSDISGNGRHFVQATSARRPVVSSGGLYFNGNTQFLDTTSHTVTSNSLSVFMVVEVIGRGTSATNYGRFYSLSGSGLQDYNNSSGIILYDKAPATTTLSLYRNSSEITAMTALNLNTKYVIGFTLSGANTLTYRNYVSSAGTTSASPTLNGVRTMLASDPALADSNLNARIYEVAVYDRPITTIESNFLVEHLQAKWSVTS